MTHEEYLELITEKRLDARTRSYDKPWYNKLTEGNEFREVKTNSRFTKLAVQLHKTHQMVLIHQGRAESFINKPT